MAANQHNLQAQELIALMEANGLTIPSMSDSDSDLANRQLVSRLNDQLSSRDVISINRQYCSEGTSNVVKAMFAKRSGHMNDLGEFVYRHMPHMA